MKIVFNRSTTLFGIRTIGSSYTLEYLDIPKGFVSDFIPPVFDKFFLSFTFKTYVINVTSYDGSWSLEYSSDFERRLYPNAIESFKNNI